MIQKRARDRMRKAMLLLEQKLDFKEEQLERGIFLF